MMERPTRIQLSRKKGWKMPSNTVKVDRSTKWGNPFVVGRHGTLTECVDDFHMMVAYKLIRGDADTKAQADYINLLSKGIEELRGKNLACWCPVGSKCHADILLHIANLYPYAPK